MRARSTTQLLIAVLAFGAAAFAFAPATTAVADDGLASDQAPMPPAVTFRRAPTWETIPGTRVSWVRQQERPGYDLFRYGSRYYIYNDGYWYRSDRLNQQFLVVDERYVPVSFSTVPDTLWRNYPPGWMNPKHSHHPGRHDNGNDAGDNHAKSNGKNRGRNSR